MNVPPESCGPLPNSWATLDKTADTVGHCTGLFGGEAPGRVGVRTWGCLPTVTLGRRSRMRLA